MKLIKSIALQIFITVSLLFASSEVSMAQSAEVEQLMLNVEKLSQLKNILADMKKGYTIVSTGYNSIKNIAQGSFSLHEVFLDGLLLVSPEVKKYYKVAEIIGYQSDILTEHKSAYKKFSSAGIFSTGELDYLERVYGKLINESVQNLDRLLMVITSSKLRMSDDERLKSIDRIHEDILDKLTFLRSFNRQTSMLGIARAKENSEIKTTSRYFQNQ
ncbi:MAG: TerB family tellurite resistance protein [Proteobacteria bacterium]|nr:MAG: TerB family tellurite resistance protein [Pseudomonadota bacterium]